MAAHAAAKEPSLGGIETIEYDYDNLDEAFGIVAYLVRIGKLSEAERVANAFIERFPHAYDGYECLGLVHKATGDNRKAAECYRKVIALTHEHPEAYKPEFRDNFQQLINELELPDTEAESLRSNEK